MLIGAGRRLPSIQQPPNRLSARATASNPALPIPPAARANNLTGDQEIDTLRKQEEHARDSVIFTSKFIKVTNEVLLRDSTQIFPIDTGLTNFENYSPLYQPGDPKISLGHLGLDARDLLFQPIQNHRV